MKNIFTLWERGIQNADIDLFILYCTADFIGREYKDTPTDGVVMRLLPVGDFVRNCRKITCPYCAGFFCEGAVQKSCA